MCPFQPVEARFEGLCPQASRLALSTVLGKVRTGGDCGWSFGVRPSQDPVTALLLRSFRGATELLTSLGFSFLFCTWGRPRWDLGNIRGDVCVWSVWHRNERQSAKTKLTLNISLYKALPHLGRAWHFNPKEDWDLHSDLWGLGTFPTPPQEVLSRACCSNKQTTNSLSTGSPALWALQQVTKGPVCLLSWQWHMPLKCTSQGLLEMPFKCSPRADCFVMTMESKFTGSFIWGVRREMKILPLIVDPMPFYHLETLSFP